MAKKATVELQVLLKAAGIKATTEQVEKLRSELKNVASTSTKVDKEMKKTTSATKEYAKQTRNLNKEQNKLVRNQKGAAETTGRQGKDFSRMAQGMGGLVQIYATIVGNVYALSTAFLVLRNAADLSSMIKSAEDFSNRFGRSVTLITERIQEATGGALSFAEALPNVNKAISASFSTEKIEALAVAATKASQTFGGTANEALGRFISAAQRGRTEIVQTLGIVLQTERVYTQYAASINKAKDELTGFDKQQAIVNAIIEESQNVFDGVNIDPNPFTQFANTITDVKDNMITAITDGFTPFINLINKSQTVAVAFILAIAGLIAKKLLPAVQDFTKGAIVAGRESSQEAIRTAQKAKQRVAELALEQSKTTRIYTAKDAAKIEKDFQNSLRKREKMHNSFKKSIIKQNGEINVAVLTEQRAMLKKQENAIIKGKGITQTLPTNLIEIRKQRVALDQVAASIEKGNIAQAKALASQQEVTRATQRYFAVAKAGYARYDAAMKGFSSQFKSGFGRIFNLAQNDLTKASKNMLKTWRLFGASVVAENVKMSKSFKRFGGAIGKTVGVIGGALSRLAGHLGTLMLLITVGALIKEKFGDAILGITPAIRELIDAQERFDETLEDSSDRIDKYMKKVGDELPTNLKELKSALDFVGGSFSTLRDSIVDLQSAFEGTLGDQTITEAKAGLNKLNSELENLENRRSGLDRSVLGNLDFSTQFNDLTSQIEAKRREIEKASGDLVAAAARASIASVGPAFKKLFEAGSTAGIDTNKLAEKLRVTFETGVEEFVGGDISQNQRNQINNLYESLLTGDVEKIKVAESTFKNAFGNSGEAVAGLIEALKTAFNEGESTVLSLAKAIGEVQQVSGDISTYFDSFERRLVDSASTFDKEYTGSIFKARNALKELSSAGGENLLLTEAAIETDDLNLYKQLLGGVAEEAKTVNDLYALAEERLKVIINLGARRQSLELESKKLQEQITQSQEKRASNDNERVKNLENTLNLTTQLRDNEYDLAVNSREIAEANLKKFNDSITAGKELTSIQESERARLEAIVSIERIREETARARAKLSAEDEARLTAIEDATIAIERIERVRNAINNSIALAKRQLVRNNAQELEQLQFINTERVKALDAEIRILRAEQNKIDVSETNRDLAKREIADLEDKVKLRQQERDILIETSDIQSSILVINQSQRAAQTEITKAQAEVKRAGDQIITSNAERLKKLQEMNSAQIKQMEAEYIILALKRAAIIADGIQTDQQKERLAAVNAELDTQGELIRNAKERNRLASAAEPYKIAKETLDVELQILQVQKETADIRLKQEYTVTSQQKTVALNLKFIDAQYKKQKQQLEIERDLLKYRVMATEQRELESSLIDAQLAKLEAEYELKREIADLNMRAANIEQGAAGVFDKQGLDIIIEYMAVGWREAAHSLEPIFKTIADGFRETIDGTFKTAIDNLLEGGKDFAFTVREAFKAGLREMFSKAITESMTKVFAITMDTIKKEIKKSREGTTELSESATSKTKTKEEERRAWMEQLYELKELKQSTNGVKDKLGDKDLTDTSSRYLIDYLPRMMAELTAIKTNTLKCGTAAGAPQIPGLPGTGGTGFGPLVSNLSPQQQTQGAVGMALPGLSSILPGAGNQPNFAEIAEELSKQTSILEEPTSLDRGTVGDLNKAPGAVSAIGVLGSVVQATSNDQKSALLAGIVAQTVELVTALYTSGFFGAKGGIAPGGFKPLADGGVINKPTLGLIGEGRNNEAVVPLPNNREIPVELRGGGETININTTQNFDFTNSSPETIAILRAEARMIEERTFNRVFGEINRGGKYAKMVGRR